MRSLVLLALVVIAAGCTGDDGLDNASTEPTVVSGSASATALLTDVGASEEDGYDRVVFTFANEVPGYDVRYVDRPIVEDGSGEEIEVGGESVLVARFEPALDADLTKEEAPATYTGPARFSPRGKAIVELVRTGGFEAVLTWAIGTTTEAPFRVTTETDPPRVIVDVSR